jgi:hypothetical protein
MNDTNHVTLRARHLCFRAPAQPQLFYQEISARGDQLSEVGQTVSLFDGNITVERRSPTMCEVIREGRSCGTVVARFHSEMPPRQMALKTDGDNTQ